MQLTTMQRTNGLSPVSWRFVWIGLALLLAAWPVAALSQDPSDTGDGLLFEEFDGQSGEAMGAVLRGGVLTGPALGREDTLTPIEVMPYFFLGEGMIFGDLRGFRSTQDNYGANVGFGYRHYVRKWDRIFGANFYYDYDNSSGQLFRQNGGGLETLGANWDMRLNTYFPVTQNTKELDLSDPFNIRFNANNILFDQIRTFGVHLKGLDHELAVPLPGRYLERHNVKGVAGWYHFQQTGVKNTFGWKGRLEGDLTSNVHLGLEVTNDNTFDTNVVFTAAVSYGGFKQPLGQPKNQFDRMTAHVHRQYNAVVQQIPTLEAGVTARNPDGTAITVEHVASNTPYDRGNIAALRRVAPQYDPTAALGTFENPFLTVADAQAPATPLSDIVFVWTNSVYNNTPLTTESGNRLLGEADNAPHTFLINGQAALLPRAVNNPDPLVPDLKPLYQNTAGDGVTLVSGIALPGGTIKFTEFSGFRLGDETVPGSGPTGSGIRAPAGANVTNVQVNFNDVNFAGVDGVLLESVGTIDFVGNRIFNSARDGFHVDGGAARVTFFRDVPTSDNFRLEIQNDGTVATTGVAVHIENMLAGSSINMAGTNPSRVDYTNAAGVLVENSVGGTAQFGEISVLNSPALTMGNPSAGINLINNGGNYTFFNAISILNPLGDGINIESQTGAVGFLDSVVVQNRNNYGIDLLNNSGDVFFNGTVDIDRSNNAVVLPTLAPGLAYQGSSGDVTFRNSLTINGGRGDGILIGEDPQNPARTVPNTGVFTSTGDVQVVSVGQLNLLGNNFVGIRVANDDAEVNFRGDVTVLGRGGTGIFIDRQRDSVSFSGATSVDNAAGAFATAVRIIGSDFFVQNPLLETNGDVFFSSLNITNALPPLLGNVAGLEVQTIQAPVVINELNITSALGTALFARFAGDPYTNVGNGRLTVTRGTIDAAAGAAIDVQDSRINLGFSSVSSDASLIQGIRMVNNTAAQGGFALVVDPSPDIDGGTIQNALLQGALFQNTGDISLNFMQFDNNTLEGILVQDVEQTVVVNSTSVSIGRVDDPIYTSLFQLDNATVTDNANEGLLAVNIPTINMTGGTFDGNGALTNQSEISLLTLQELIDLNDRTIDTDDVELTYTYTITDVTVNEVGLFADAIEVGSPGVNATDTPQLSFTMVGTDPALAIVTLDTALPNSGLLIDLNGRIDANITGYTFLTEATISSGVIVNQREDTETLNLNFVNNVIDLLPGATNSFGLDISSDGAANVVVNDNVFIIDAGAFGSTALRMTLNGTANIVIDGTDDNVYPAGIPDDANLANPNQPYGNLFIINDTDSTTSPSRAIDLNFRDDATATISNNLIDNTTAVFTPNVDGIVITNRGTLTLNGQLNNAIFLDTFGFNGQFQFSQQGTGPNWFILNGTGVVNGSILVNGVPQP